MDTNLFRVSKVCWAVTSEVEAEVQTFTTIDDAGMYLESIGVPDEEVDMAIIDMVAKGTVRANFGVTNGHFIFSDDAKLTEPIGVA